MATYNLENKVVVITGATGGIGAAVANALLAKGAKLVLVDLGQARLDAMAAAMPTGRVLAHAADVTDGAAMQGVADHAVETFRRIDVCFANAGISTKIPATCATYDPMLFERIIEVNLFGVWRTVRPCLPEIIKSHGYVLGTSSIYAFANGMANAPYAISKAGVEALCRSLRAELAHTGAKAGTLYPGWIATDIAKVAFGGHVLATRMVAHAYPGFLNRPIKPEALAVEIVAGIEKRAPRIVIPRRWAPIMALRGVLNILSDRMLDGDSKMQGFVKELEAENRAHSLKTIEKADEG